ncbi:MAG: hypothetical protein AB8B55_04940 [Mariniblastus sp.]
MANWKKSLSVFATSTCFGTWLTFAPLCHSIYAQESPLPPARDVSTMTRSLAAPTIIVRPSIDGSALNDCEVEVNKLPGPQNEFALRLMVPDSVTSVELIPNSQRGAERNFRIQMDQTKPTVGSVAQRNASPSRFASNNVPMSSQIRESANVERGSDLKVKNKFGSPRKGYIPNPYFTEDLANGSLRSRPAQANMLIQNRNIQQQSFNEESSFGQTPTAQWISFTDEPERESPNKANTEIVVPSVLTEPIPKRGSSNSSLPTTTQNVAQNTTRNLQTIFKPLKKVTPRHHFTIPVVRSFEKQHPVQPVKSQREQAISPMPLSQVSRPPSQYGAPKIGQVSSTVTLVNDAVNSATSSEDLKQALESIESKNSDTSEPSTDTLICGIIGSETVDLDGMGEFAVYFANPTLNEFTDVIATLELPHGMDVVLLDRAASLDRHSRTIKWNLDDMETGAETIVRFRLSAKTAGEKALRLRISAKDQNQTSIDMSRKLRTIVVSENTSK